MKKYENFITIFDIFAYRRPLIKPPSVNYIGSNEYIDLLETNEYEWILPNYKYFINNLLKNKFFYKLHGEVYFEINGLVFPVKHFNTFDELEKYFIAVFFGHKERPGNVVIRSVNLRYNYPILSKNGKLLTFYEIKKWVEKLLRDYFILKTFSMDIPFDLYGFIKDTDSYIIFPQIEDFMGDNLYYLLLNYKKNEDEEE